MRANAAAAVLLSFSLALAACAPDVAPDAPALVLEGQAVLDDGNADDNDNGGIQVVLTNPDRGAIASIVTDGSGRFVFVNVARVSYEVAFAHEGYLPQAGIPVTWAGGRHQLEPDGPILLSPDRSAGLTGQLSTPLAGFDFDRAVVRLAGPTPGSVEPSADGSFALDDLAPGAYVLQVDAEGHDRWVQAVALGSRERADLGDLRLTPASAAAGGQVLAGTARLAGSTRHDGILVQAFLGAALLDTSVTDSEGRFALALSETGTFRIALSKAGYVDAVLEPVGWDGACPCFAVAGDAIDGHLPVELSVRRDAGLRGQLVSRGQTFDDWDVRVRQAAIWRGAERVETLDVRPGGAFTLEQSAQAGLVTLAIDAAGHQPFSRVVELTSGELDLGELVLIPDAQTDARIVLAGRACRGDCAAEGVDHGGIAVRLTVGGNSLGTVETEPDGRFSVPTSRAAHRMSLTADGYVGIRDLDLAWSEVNGRFEVDGQALADHPGFALARDVSATVTGRLTTTVAAFDLSVAQLRLEGESSLTLPVLANGDLSASGVPPGVYTMTTSVPGHRTRTDLLTLRSGSNALGTLPLEPTPVQLTGRVDRADSADDSGVVVRLFRGPALIDATLTGDGGEFALATVPVAHRLTFGREGYEAPTPVDVTWSSAADRFEVDALPLPDPLVRLERRRDAQLGGQLASSDLVVDDWSATVFAATLQGDAIDVPVAVASGGGLTIAEPIPSGIYVLNIDAAGHLPLSRPVILEPGPNDLGTITLSSQLELPDGGVLMSGRACLGACDAAIDHSGIVVRALVNTNAVATTVTDAAGAFVLRTVEDNHTLQLARSGYAAPPPVAVTFSQGTFRVGDVLLTEHQILLQPDVSASISGSLVTSVVGFDPSRATITVRGPTTRTFAAAPDGTFAQSSLSPGFYAIDLSAPGHAPTRLVTTLASGPNALGAIALEPLAVPLLGRVELEGAASFEDVIVRLFRDGEPIGTTLTDPAGTFAFQTLPLTHSLTFARNGFVSSADVVTAWDPADERFEVADEALAGLSIRLVANRSATLTARLTSTLVGLDWPSIATVRVVGQGEERLATIASDGTVQATDLVPGLYGVEFNVGGHLPLVRVVELGEGTTRLGDIQLIPEFDAPEAAVLMVGQAHLAAQTRHLGIIVQAFIGGNLAGSAVTAEDGRFALLASRSNYTLRFVKDGYTAQTLDVVWNDAQQRFEAFATPLVDYDAVVLPQVLAASLRARLTSPIPAIDWASDAVVRLRGASDRTAPVAADGSFFLDGLADGLYALEVQLVGHMAWSTVVTLGGAELDLGAIDLAPIDVQLGATVLLDAETSHADTTVRIRRSDVLIATTLTDEAGTFVATLPPNDYTLSLTHADFITEQYAVTWDEAAGRFEVDGRPLAAETFTLERTPSSDRDRDGRIDVQDNCPALPNPNQDDLDGDGLGDACDGDIDQDGIVNGLDNCPYSANPAQEDPDGDGRGVRCDGGDAASPFTLGCGTRLQRLDTRERADHLSASCGGSGAPELVYAFSITNGESIDVRARAEHALVTYVLDRSGPERGCVLGGNLRIEAGTGNDANTVRLPAGDYLLVLDGLVGAQSSGPVNVDIVNSACAHTLGGQAALNLPIDGEARGIELYDRNGDGFGDLHLANLAKDRVELYDGRRDGGFEDPIFIPVGDGPWDLLIPDQGSRPIVTTDLISDTLSVIEQRNGVFQHVPGSPMAVGDYPNAVAYGKIYDRSAGLVTANTQANTITIVFLTNQVFPAITVNVGSQPYDVEAPDINNDGWDDIVVANRASNTLSVFIHRGNIDGQLSPVVTVPTGSTPELLVKGDFNEDGYEDVIDNGGNADFQSFGSFHAGQANGTLAARVALGLLSRSRIFDVVDFNGDGHLDLNTGTAVFLGAGDGTFAPERPLRNVGADLPVTNPTDVETADLNGDGQADTIASAGTAITILSTAHVNVDIAPQDVAMVDMNGDGRLDLVSANRGYTDENDPMNPINVGTSATVLLANGDGGFASAGRFVLYGSQYPATVKLTTGDVNEDGHEDVIGLIYKSRIQVLTGHGDGTLGAAVSLPWQDFGDDPIDLVVRDLNGDRHLDLATLDQADESVTVIDGVGDGTFVNPRHYPLPGSAIRRGRDLDVGDVDNDGDLDLVIAQSDTVVGLAVLLNDGNGAFTEGAVPRTTAARTSVTIGDLNSDGLNDLVTGAVAATSIRVALGQPDGAIGPWQEVTTTFASPLAVTVGDANGDRIPDILAAASDLYVLYGRGDGAFSPGAARQNKLPIKTMAVGDLNGDGRLDVVVPNEHYDDLSLLLGRGGPLFDRPEFTDLLDNGAGSLAPGDFDRDGILDLAYTTGPGPIGVLRGLGDGRYAARQTLAHTWNLNQLKAHDLDGDGVLDLLDVSGSTGQVVVALGAPDGSFGGFTAYPAAGTGAWGLAFGDFDEDGATDVVTTVINQAQVQLLPGDGTGGLAAARVIGTGILNTYAVAAADLNQDGHLDVVTTSNASGIAVLLGHGDGTFDLSRWPSAGLDTYALALGDMNGDGRLDAVTTTTNVVIVQLGLPGGAFGAGRRFPSSGFPYEIALVDLNGDGHLDVFSPAGAVLLNRGDGSLLEPIRVPGVTASRGVAADIDANGSADLLVGDINRDRLVVIRQLGALQPGAAFARSAIPACAPASLDAAVLGTGMLAWDIATPTPCRIDRLELDLTFDPTQAPTALTFTGPTDHRVTLPTVGAPWPGPGAWRPSAVAPLARFADHTAAGPWRLNAPFAIPAATLEINRAPLDPFDATTPAPTCTANVDQDTDPDNLCVLPGANTPDNAFWEATLAAIPLPIDDADAFILQGPDANAFVAGRLLHVTVTATGGPVAVDLLAARARLPLATALEVAPGQWELTWLAPSRFDRRTLVLRVQALGAAVNYDVDVDVEL